MLLYPVLKKTETSASNKINVIAYKWHINNGSRDERKQTSCKKKKWKILLYYNPITSESIKIEWSAINDE